jgi:hypothetical protein
MAVRPDGFYRPGRSIFTASIVVVRLFGVPGL